MLKITVLVLSGLIFISSTSANVEDTGGWSDSWPFSPEQLMEGGDFAQHVKQLCLSQIHEEDLDAKYIKEYLLECAADYGVFDLAAH
jgi:hypothetical protein